jgi:hypothetical protein
VTSGDSPADAFAGIDVACAKSKRLPVCVCVRRGPVLQPLALRQYAVPRPPYGCGNAGCLDPETIQHLAKSASVYLKEVEDHFGVRVQRVAIDAPSNPRSVGVVLREAERGLSARASGLSAVRIMWVGTRFALRTVQVAVVHKMGFKCSSGPPTLVRAAGLILVLLEGLRTPFGARETHGSDPGPSCAVSDLDLLPRDVLIPSEVSTLVRLAGLI